MLKDQAVCGPHTNRAHDGLGKGLGLEPFIHVALLTLLMPNPLVCDFQLTNRVSHHTKAVGARAGICPLAYSAASIRTVARTLLSQYLLEDREGDAPSHVFNSETP